MTADDGRPVWSVIHYDVPVYGQYRYRLCWAFCQIMIESYHSGITLSQKDATDEAIALAKSVYPIRNRCCNDARIVEPQKQIWERL